MLHRSRRTGVFLEAEASAQAEQFFYSRRLIRIAEEAEGRITLPITWPQLALEELDLYGVVKPQGDMQA
jgi:hypothetical protein